MQFILEQLEIQKPREKKGFKVNRDRCQIYYDVIHRLLIYRLKHDNCPKIFYLFDDYNGNIKKVVADMIGKDLIDYAPDTTKKIDITENGKRFYELWNQMLKQYEFLKTV